MVAPSQSRRPPRAQPRPRPSPARGAYPAYGAARRRRRRGLPILVLLVLTLGVVAYFLVGRSGGSGGNSTDFVTIDQRLAATARGIPAAAQRVQRFTELHRFDAIAVAALTRMSQDVAQLQRLSAGESASGRTIIHAAVAAAQQAIDAAGRYRQAVAFSYRLVNAEEARQDLLAATTLLDQEAKAWASH